LSETLATDVLPLNIMATAIRCPAPVAGIVRFLIGFPAFDVLLTMAQEGMAVNVAVGLRLLFMTTVQGLPPVQTPLHPENVQPLPAVAFIVTELPIE
jgi:hypothetical protein